MAIVAPSAEGVVPSPPPVGTASAQSNMPDSLAPPPSVPHSLVDTLPFVVDLENHVVSPHTHPPLTGDVQPPPLASPPPSPSFSVARPCLLHPSSPSVRSAVARSPGPSPGTSSASWSLVPPVFSLGSVSASVFAPRSRWQDGTLSASYRPRGFGSMEAHIAVPPPPPPFSFRPAPRVDMPAPAPPAYKKFKPVPAISVPSHPASVSLPLPPAPLELKLTGSATQSMYLASGRSSESSASQTDQQYSALLVRWREFLSELGAASALYSEASASQNRDFLLDRAAMKFAPSTLLRYFDAWLNWSSFCRLADASPHDPPPGLLPDWLKSQSSRRGLATMQLRALAWFVKTAGLPKLKVCLCAPICQAFAVASNPQEHRESLPLSLSFVMHLEKSILDPLSSPAEVLRLGYLLLCIWGSLRWGDALWCPPSRLHYQPQSHALVGICLRTKTTKRGMPFGVFAAGLSGTASQCWSLRFLSVLRQSVADTLAINPNRHLDFLPAALSGSESRPIISAPLKRERMVLWLRGLLLRHWRIFSQAAAPAAFGLVAAHSLKCTVLSWARQLHVDSDLRRIQGHHRQSGSDRSVSLYSRDDILPMLRLQRLVVDAVRSGFRPLQPMARGLGEPLPDFPVVLPSSSSLPELGPLSSDCLPEALPCRPCLPLAPSASPSDSSAPVPAAGSDDALESLSSESSDSSAEEATVPDEPALFPTPKAVSPPPSASVSAFGHLWNARSNVVHVAMRTEPSAPRSKSFLVDGATVWLRPLCGARTHQLDPDRLAPAAFLGGQPNA